MKLRRVANNLGATTLFVAAVVLPMLFFVFSLSLDISRYYTANEKLQKVLDEAVTYGQRFLPYQEEARRVTEAFLDSHGIRATDAQVQVDGDRVAVILSTPLQLTFPRYFGLDAAVPLTAYSRSRGAPVDAFIALDASTYLAPPVLGGNIWGDPLQWPAASFFGLEQTVYDGTTALDASVVTQQCFNSAFSGLKLASLQAYEYLAGFSKNAVGVAVYPGYGNYLDLLRDVVSADERAVGAGEVDFSFYTDIHNRNVLCAAAAEREQVHRDYKFPAANTRLDPNPSSNPAGTFVFPGPDATSNLINAAYLPGLRARESLWAQSVREGAYGDVAEALREARARTIGSTYTGDRGGLDAYASKIIFIFAGDIAWAAGARFPDGASKAALTQQFDAIKQDIAFSGAALNVRIFYVVFRHPGNDTPDFDSRMTEFSLFLAQEAQIGGVTSPQLQIDLVQVADADALTRVALGPLLMSGRTAVLSR